ncbi:MAG: ADP-ribosylglycohydrolase family protein [Acidobacteriota bacterium]|jgi:type I restriction enzyme M protein|nr:ADP-ribosylglycohydrolase family protein [Acidobacteriota bacterium]
MLGAIIGDVAGSRFEFHNHRSKDFDLFGEGCFATDDSIMSLAVAKALMDAVEDASPSSRGGACGYDEAFHARLAELTVERMREIGRKYPRCGFGGRFYDWLFSDAPAPYGSFGNGAAMRVSPAGFAARTEREAGRLAETVTAVTHDHPEGVKGAQATAMAIFWARRGATKDDIRRRIARDYYALDFTVDAIRPTYRFNETCQGTVPQAIECFLESSSFEDAIRTAISLGGDSDTVAAITGSIAEAHYGVPEEIRETALSYLDAELRAIYDRWTEFVAVHA